MSDTSLLTAGFELKRKIVHAETESTDLLKPGLPLFAAVPFEFIDDPAVSDAYARAVYMVLRRYSDFANGDHAFPSVKTIAKNVHCSERKVQQSIGQLVQTGWLSVKRKGGRGLSNEYQLSLRKGCIQCTLSKLPTKRVHVVPKKGAPGAVYLDTLTKRHIAPSAPSVTSKPKKKKSPPTKRAQNTIPAENEGMDSTGAKTTPAPTIPAVTTRVVADLKCLKKKVKRNTASVDAASKTSDTSHRNSSTEGKKNPQPLITDLFHKKYAVRPGGKPPWGGKEGALLKGDLKRLGVDKLAACVELFFNGAPRNVVDWALQSGWTYGVFHSQIPKLEAALAEERANHSLLRTCPHCGRQQENTSAYCLSCRKPFKEAVHAG